MALINVYDSIKAWPEGTKIKQLRILQLVPMSVPSGAPPHETGRRIAEAGDSVVPVRWVLGTVPVEADGSAHFKVPAYRELFFQALDERGLAVQSMRSGTYVRAGERLVCQGCHEPKSRASTAAALFRWPCAGPLPSPSPTWTARIHSATRVWFSRCWIGTAFSATRRRQRPRRLNLAREPIQNQWYASYNSLVNYGFTRYGDGYRTTPGQFGARASKLLELLDKGHHDLKLTSEDFHRLALWLDCSSMFYGVFEKEGGEAQLLGGIARPSLE